MEIPKPNEKTEETGFEMFWQRYKKNRIKQIEKELENNKEEVKHFYQWLQQLKNQNLN